MSDPFIISVALLAILLAGFIQGLTGFGFALASVPIITMFINPQLAVPAIIVQATVANIPILWHARRHLKVRRMWLMALSGMLGIPVGTLALMFLDASVLRLIIGLIVSLAAIAMMVGFKRRLEREFLFSAPVGFASGLRAPAPGCQGRRNPVLHQPEP
jgi:uncharacterized membrane protein YfcA